MPVLNSQTVADKYPLSTGTKGAIIANVWNSRGGWFSVTGATAWVQLQYGEQGQDHWVEEIFLGAGAFVVVPPNCRGLQFRNGVAGVTATVTAQIAQGDEPPLAISTIGQTNTVLVSSLNFQHNTLAVATEPTLDFEDSAGVLNFAPVDDPANTRVKLTVSFPNPVLIPGTLQIGNADTFLSRSSANTLDLGNSGTRGALRLFASATTDVELSIRVTADANPRFTLGGDGSMAWGTGAAVTDSTFLRLAVGVLGSTTTALSTGPTSNAVGGAAGVFLDTSGRVLVNRAANSSPTIGTDLVGDTFWRFQVDTNGVHLWGPGNAAGDAGIQRYGVNQLGITTQPGYWRSLHAAVGVIGGDGVNSSWAINDQGAASHCFFQSVAPSGFNSLATSVIADAGGWRFLLTSDGSMTWGGGAAVGDVTLKRAVNSPSGTGSFLELTAGAGLGYGTGTGGTVTQLTSLTTGVTLNKPTGQITTFTSAIAGNLNVTFTVTNSVVGTQDGVVVWWRVNAGNNNMPIWCSGTSAGSFQISYTNLGALTGSVTNIIGFAVIKGATS